MGFGWIKPEEYSFHSLLLFERFQISYMFRPGREDKWRRHMGIALNANPAVKWYLERRCPERAGIIAQIAAEAPVTENARKIREAEVYVIESAEDFMIYTTPEAMAERCDFIRGWNKQRLFSLADFTGKTVLDVGAGSGRLTFAAAEKAMWVYASEPAGTLREFMREKIARENIRNVRVLDGFVTALPFPDSTFDIVMSGHVMGDDWDNEIAETSRVCKNGGWLLNCPGDSERHLKPKEELTSRGFEEFHYVGSFGKDVYIQRKQAIK